jgi:hypothetical protein
LSSDSLFMVVLYSIMLDLSSIKFS